MTEENTKQFNRKIGTEMYISAYLFLLTEVKTEGRSKETIQLTKKLSEAVRDKAYMFAIKKADNRAIEMESLLKLIKRTLL